MNAPVWAAPASERTPFPEDHPLFRGELPFAIGPLSEKLEGHDLALVVGAPVFRYYPYVAGPYLPAGMRLLHISDDPAETSRAPVGDSIVGDAALSLAALSGPALGHAPSHGKAPARRAHDVTPRPSSAKRLPGPPAVRGGRVRGAERDPSASRRPGRGVLRPITPTSTQAWPITEPDTYYTFASGGLGWDLPASVGIALAERESARNRPVVAIIGDGSFQYSVQSIWSAAQLRLGMLIVVMRNDEYAILKSFAALERTPGVPGLELGGMDFVSIAQGYGCDSRPGRGSRRHQARCRTGLEPGRSDGVGGADLPGDLAADLT